MTWVAPRTWVTGELVTATMMNEQLSGNLAALNIALGAADLISSAQSTTSTSFTDLATVGPTVTLTTGSSVACFVTAECNHNGVRHYMAVAVSNATTRAASQDEGILAISADGYADTRHTACFVISGLTPGSNTFTAKYKVGSGTGTFGLRHLAVMRLPAIS